MDTKAVSGYVAGKPGTTPGLISLILLILYTPSENFHLTGIVNSLKVLSIVC